ncbi:MAG: heavy metal-binding domain-containing protein [Bacteroidales bacterium]|nr:heavy metal-binding domain-containing protein [Bacteroidales bacterium]
MTNTETIAHKEITETLGMVRGNSTRARFFGRDIVVFIKNVRFTTSNIARGVSEILAFGTAVKMKDV